MRLLLLLVPLPALLACANGIGPASNLTGRWSAPPLGDNATLVFNLAQRDLPLRDMFDRYELYIYKQWLRVYMQSKMIKHNKDLFECVDDPLALLDKLHIY